MAFEFQSIFDSVRSFLAQNSLGDYIAGVSAAAITFLVLIGIKFLILGHIKRIAKKTKTSADDILIQFIEDIHWPFYLFISLFVGLRLLFLPDIFSAALNYMLLIFIIFYLTVAISRVVDYIAEREIKKRQKEEEKKEQTSFIKVIGTVIKALVWVVAILLVLSNLGFNITSLIAGLGVGGIAIAFALQKILEDIFASFSIYFDKPFREGDFIVIGTDMGIIKRIGLKTTRITTLQGQELVVSNKELTSIRINNFKKMVKRRVVMNFGVEYETPVAKLKKIPGIVSKIISGIKKAEIDRAHFKQYGDFSLNFEVVYYVDTNDYAKYMDIQQEINLKLKSAFEKEKIVFAYPSQTIYVKR